MCCKLRSACASVQSDQSSMGALRVSKVYSGKTTDQTDLNLCCRHMPKGVQWLSDRVLDSRLRGRRSEPHRHHCVVSLSKTH